MTRSAYSCKVCCSSIYFTFLTLFLTLSSAISTANPSSVTGTAFNMFKRKLACVPLKSDPTIRRSHLSPDELITRPAGDEVKIVGDIFSYTVSISIIPR